MHRSTCKNASRLPEYWRFRAGRDATGTPVNAAVRTVAPATAAAATAVDAPAPAVTATATAASSHIPPELPNIRHEQGSFAGWHGGWRRGIPRVCGRLHHRDGAGGVPAVRALRVRVPSVPGGTAQSVAPVPASNQSIRATPPPPVLRLSSYS